MKAYLKLFAILLIFGNTIIANQSDNYEEAFRDDIKQIMDGLNARKTKASKIKFLEVETPKIFSLEYISLWALGSYSRSFSAKQIDDYLKISKDYIVLYYGSLLIRYYNDYNINIVGSEPSGKNEYIVLTEITHKKRDIDSSQSTITANWKLRYNQKMDKYYIIDVIVNSISLVNAQRTEFESILRQNGGDIDILITTITNKYNSLKGS